jgi:hypothetical protein
VRKAAHVFHATALCIFTAVAAHAQGLRGPSAPPVAVGPDPAIAAARAAAHDTARGRHLRVVLLTVGLGADVYERFGHNLLAIRDDGQSDVVWNWGLFDFDEPGFVSRFLFGNTRYWMDSASTAPELSHYASRGRGVVAQELALTPGQRAAIDAFVRANVLAENRFYRYDYFRDNCSTRLRDALDIVLDGALYKALSAERTAHTYRTEALRVVQHNRWLLWGMDLALGAPADRPLSVWETSFMPGRLRDALRNVTTVDERGESRPLVAAEWELVAPSFDEPMAIAPSSRPLPALYVALAIAVIAVVGSALIARGVRGATSLTLTLAGVVHLALGLMGSLLLFMWMFTRHVFWAWNPHLLLFTPLSLLIAIALPAIRRRPALLRTTLRYHVVMALLAFAVAVSALVRAETGGGEPYVSLQLWAHACWLCYVGLAVALRTLSAGPAAPNTGITGGSRATFPHAARIEPDLATWRTDRTGAAERVTNHPSNREMY